MTPEQFNQWLVDMRDRGVVKSDRDAATQLGMTANGLLVMKRRGGNRRTALACQAIAHGLTPWGASTTTNEKA